ncbi:DUF5054 domain-containing protein [Parabacteroides sp. TM07-1AC]|uniref:DUF5054 domain-containing protein n=1 Tax=Parabacteroides sp. TM07-1AC TaxID=2292363 RepID=UPI000F00307F|nr:DUF5054 domain-containing protein [Parabacteroides sp. TM07-1AC]RHU29393.1 DUF5054 domain-containing protein [Parabacteroides sp. TM07-1AC]
MKRMLILLLLVVGGLCQLVAQEVNTSVDKVYVVFKTHLDVGFTDLSSVVTQRYITEFIPKALDVSEKLRAENASEKYVWTTGAWLIWKYLHTASPEEVKRLEAAIGRGDIVWNSVPYTVESESMNLDLFETSLLLSHKLDEKYGKKTIAAKMTDVPGHTRSIVSPMSRAGIRFLHIGVNPACPIPNVPEFCRWRDTDGSELILVYQQDYGSENILPGGKAVISINFTGDNHGPHSYEKVKEIYADLHKRYPNARLVACSFNEIAEELIAMQDQLPVVTSEIGDTWIYGYGSAPIRMAKFRALSELYSQWLREKKIDKNSDAALDFVLELGLIAEHTQGVDVKTHLHNWDKYDMDLFLPARATAPFRKAEASWKELDDYIYNAIQYLPQHLQAEALAKMKEIDQPVVPVFTEKAQSVSSTPWQAAVLKKGALKLEGLSYQMYDAADYKQYLDNYLRAHYGWALADIGKPGLDKSKAVSVSLSAQTIKQEVRKEKKGIRTVSELVFQNEGKVDQRVLPEKMYIDVLDYKNGKKAEVTLTIKGKPAVRLPEAYWLSFTTDDILSIVAEKVGGRVDLLDVVEKGNRQQHGIDRYVDLITSNGTIRIWSEAAFLVNVGEARGINYSLDYPDKKGGVHFNLSNNLWNTNFRMWNEGSLTYRFTIERID